MRYINIDLSSDNHLQQLKIFGGYAGEHNETVLQVTLPQRMIGIEYSDYRFDFQTSEDNEIPVPVSKLINGVLSCHLTEQLTVAGKLLFNVVARKLDGKVVSLTSKTNMVNLYIGDSPDGNSVLPDPTGYKDEMLKIIDAQITEALKGIQTGEGGLIIVDQTYNSQSENAQSGKAVADAMAYKQDAFAGVTISDGNVTVTSNGDGTTAFVGKRLVLRGEERGLGLSSGNGEITLDSCKLSYLGLPIQPHQATNKEYVDNLVGDIETTLDTIISIQENLIGGGSV